MRFVAQLYKSTFFLACRVFLWVIDPFLPLPQNRIPPRQTPPPKPSDAPTEKIIDTEKKLRGKNDVRWAATPEQGPELWLTTGFIKTWCERSKNKDLWGLVETLSLAEEVLHCLLEAEEEAAKEGGSHE